MKPRIYCVCVLLSLSSTAWGQAVYELLPAGAQNNHRVGAGVDLDGDVAVVGAPGAAAAYVFRFNGSDWVEEQTLTPSVVSGGFGNVVAVQGESIVIGAQSGGSSTSGSVFFYRYISGTWVEVSTFRKSGGQTIIRYGDDVDVDGDVAVVSDYVVNDGQNHGTVYTYAFDGTTWSETGNIAPADGLPGGSFGYSISLDDPVLLVGMPYDRISAAVEQVGSAYVYRRNGSTWALEQKVVSPAREANDVFGRSVDLSGDVAMIQGGLDVEAYRYDGSIWTFEQALSGSDSNRLGYPIATSDQTVAINDGVNVAVYGLVSGAWAHTGDVTASDGDPIGTFGLALAVDGDRLIVGSEGHTHDGVKTGAAYVFESASGVANDPSRPASSADAVFAQAFPNPFVRETALRITLANREHVTVDVYDLTGRHVSRVHQELLEAGDHILHWNAESLPQGAYLVQVRTPNGNSRQLVSKMR